MEKLGWTGYEPPGGAPPRREPRSLDAPDFSGMDQDEVLRLVNEMLGERIDPQNLAGWWEFELFAGQTPSTMLTAGRYRQVWLLAEASVADEARDVTHIEHISD